VLLDLMVIKTVASFTARPMLWFAMLSLPMLAIAAAALGWTCFNLAATGKISLSIAGTGVIFLTSTVMLLAAGALGELIYELGDVREHQFSGLTQRLLLASGRRQ
jgi:ammonia channel protein AmtB